MSATASWIRNHAIEVAWGLFALANLVAMAALAGEDGGTVPFHFIWVSLTVLYGFTVWRVWPTVLVLCLVMSSTAAVILFEVATGPTRPDELTEVPLMAAMFAAMVWHARRRVDAEEQSARSHQREREFIRDSSHHLKTPLALARGQAELVRAGGLSPVQRRDTDVLVTELDRMTKIVDSLLLFNTSERSDAIERRDVDLGQLVLDVAGRWMDSVERSWLIDVDAAGILRADEELLRCALDALLDNAVEATEVGERISIGADEENGLATVRVADEGRGIPRESIEHIFQRFWTDAGRKKRRGTGLGLAIVKSIVDAHDGTVSVRSDEFETVFTLRLGPYESRTTAGPDSPGEALDAHERVPAVQT